MIGKRAAAWAWSLSTLLWMAVVGISVQTYALQRGAIDHDLYCAEHGTAVKASAPIGAPHP